ncbi:MAG: post-COAP-1 domain-containing protein [Clostridiales bacterium]
MGQEINFKDSNDIDQNEWMRHTYWYRIERVGQNIKLYISNDGTNYELSRSFELPDGVEGTQRIILDQIIWTSAGSYVDWDYFRVTENNSNLDDVAPEIKINNLVDGGVYINSVSPEIIITDNEFGIATKSIKLDGVDYVSETEITSKGLHTLVVDATDNAGNSSSETINFTINKSTNTDVTATDSQYSDNATLEATLTSEGNPIEGKLINFELNDIYIGSATTDENGIATFDHKIDLPTGTYPVREYFEEDDTNYLNASEGTTDINITEENTSILYDGNYLVENSTLVNLSAIVIEEDDGELGDLTNASVDFEVSLVNSDGTSTPINTYNAPCNELGEAIKQVDLEPGVYSIVAKIKDNGYYEESETTAMCVVYDPNGGKATGGGWISEDSNKSNFGFNVKYKNGLATGNLEFQSKESDINLKSEQIDWLVINGNEASFQGTGTIKNMDGEYTFRINCIDSSVEKFTIKIWEGTDTEVDPIYKALNVELGGGNIKVKEN